ncbi:30S ribosomal protein S18 [Hoyosella rhizosphaerae]|uniref:Small ribosomal subunit protein bS18 n=2 Tax=Hoyosella rhizosphaerae TaxID=1755582 RepID=A0A916U811_9ACTN|nr:30S ribosomal protein S18 [Hoyosella rhizosphaerae]MBN4927533.1 30S ribosomal protein S18 [Hoyosella rhizosphaerae]GGC63739.1 30S ribosomal protein S18 1 [Hoyosella rhizosphaerae]
MSHANMRQTQSKTCTFCVNEDVHIDYKDTALLGKYVSDHGKLRARRVTGICVQHQMDVAAAVKVSREMALLPYTSTAR